MGKRFNRQQRTTARLALVQHFFVQQHGEGIEGGPKSILDFFDPSWEKPDIDFVNSRYKSIAENLPTISQHIENGLQEGWKESSLDKVLHSLLAVATDEMISTHKTTPPEILVKEYADLAGDFFGAPEVSFVNAYLNALKEKVQSNNL